MPAAALPPDAATLQAVAEASAAALVIVGGNGQIEWVNRAFSECTGFASAEAVGRPWDEVLIDAGEQAGSRLGTAPDAPLAALPARFERQTRHADGSPLVLAVTAVTIEGGRRQVLTLDDRTALRQAETERQCLRELLDVAQRFGHFGVWERDARTLQARWDPQVFRLWGWPAQPGGPSFAEASQRVHPDDRHEARVLQSLNLPGEHSVRFRVLRDDGRQAHLRSEWTVLAGPDGQPQRAVGIMVDETEADALQQALQEADARLRMAVELAGIATWRHDLKTGLMHYDARAWKVVGLPPRPGGLPIEEVRELIHPDDRARVIASAERALHDAAPTELHARYRRSDGHWRHVMTRRIVQRSPSGEPLAFLGVSVDITEQAEPAMRAVELAQRLQSAARAARLGVWSTTLNQHLDAPAEWNAQMYELFGLSPDQPAPSMGEWLTRYVHPDDRERVSSHGRTWLTQGERAFEIEFRVACDGEPRWIVARGDIDVRDGVPRLFGVAIDITEHHRTLERLRDTVERATLAARGVGIGTWDHDALRGVDHWDEQMFRLRGLQPSPAAPPLPDREALVHPDDLPTVQQTVAAAHGSGRQASYEFRVRWPDGSWRWLAARSAAVLDEHGREVRRIGVNWDITDAKTAELTTREKDLALRESEAKSRFLARMSHELRTPLNAVLGFTQLLLAGGERHDADTRRQLRYILEAGEHLLTLIDDVLQLSAYESGKRPMEMQPVPLQPLFAQALPLLSGAAALHDVTLDAGRLDATPLADPTRLRQVLLNLLSNAIKYNRRGGRVLVEATQAGDEVLLLVSDDGVGMSEEQLRHVFEPFNRLGRERDDIQGTGIGLAIVKSLVEHMQGSVQVRSEVGRGTCFEVRLRSAPPPESDPVAEAGAAAPMQAAETGAGPGADGRGVILYIEDNAVNMLIVQELVALRPQLELHGADDGGSGIALARSLQPDLVLVDMQLPDMDGHGVLRALRADPTTAGIPCIALSANAMPEDIRRARQAGFDDYWTKPLQVASFLAALDTRFGKEVPVMG